MYKNIKLSLVEAGPGDPDLLTLKAWKAIQKAEIILYDALVSKEILEIIPSHIPRVHVGKQCGKNSPEQANIPHLIVEVAQHYKHIVRLKGADSFVFGRSQEEAEYLQAFGMQTEVIPGISSALAVPGTCGIPVTHRGANESFWVITAHSQQQHIDQDVALAAQSSATMVILMDTYKLAPLICSIKKYRSPDTPVALIQHGTLPDEKVIVGYLDDIVLKGERLGFGIPEIMVVGEVVAAHKTFKAAVVTEALYL